MNKLEKVALRYSRRTGKSLVLILNNIHYFQNDEDGRNMLLQLQQRAEAWAASGRVQLYLSGTRDLLLYALDILTMVFSRYECPDLSPGPFHIMICSATISGPSWSCVRVILVDGELND